MKIKISTDAARREELQAKVRWWQSIKIVSKIIYYVRLRWSTTHPHSGVPINLLKIHLINMGSFRSVRIEKKKKKIFEGKKIEKKTMRPISILFWSQEKVAVVQQQKGSSTNNSVQKFNPSGGNLPSWSLSTQRFHLQQFVLLLLECSLSTICLFQLIMLALGSHKVINPNHSVHFPTCQIIIQHLAYLFLPFWYAFPHQHVHTQTHTSQHILPPLSHYERNTLPAIA